MKEYTKISIDLTFEQLFFLHSFAQGTVFHADANCPLINLFVSVCVVNNSKEGNFSSSNRGSHSPKDFNFVQKLFVLIEKLTAKLDWREMSKRTWGRQICCWRQIF